MHICKNLTLIFVFCVTVCLTCFIAETSESQTLERFWGVQPVFPIRPNPRRILPRKNFDIQGKIIPHDAEGEESPKTLSGIRIHLKKAKEARIYRWAISQYDSSKKSFGYTFRNIENGDYTIEIDTRNLPTELKQTPLIFSSEIQTITVEGKDINADDIKVSKTNYALNEIIIKLKDKKYLSSINALNSRFSAIKIRKLFPQITNITNKLRQRLQQRKLRASRNLQVPNLDNIYLLKFKHGSKILSFIKHYQQNPFIEYAEPNYIYKIQANVTDPYFSTLGTWGQDYDDLWGLENIQAEKAWDIAKGKDVIVAVVDTGIDYLHEDISANMWTNENEIPDNGIDDDKNEYIDDYFGYDFSNKDHDPMDGFGHGTHVAGTIAATGNNHIGIIGVAPEAKVMALKGLNDKASGEIEDLAEAIVYATNMGADVINNSWGGPHSNLINDAINKAHSEGVVIIAAAGNNSTDACLSSPAGLEHVLTVASSDHADVRTDFSNVGPCVEVSAPGGESGFKELGPFDSPIDISKASIVSLRASNTDQFKGRRNYTEGDAFFPVQGDFNSRYYRSLGTSMASPHVAGLAALLLSQNPALTSDELFGIIIGSVDPVSSDENIGSGRINVYKALTGDVQFTKINFLDFTFKEEIGNGNGRPDPGERIQLILRFHNFSGKANNIKINVTSKEQHISIINEEQIIPQIDGHKIFSANFLIDIDQNAPKFYFPILSVHLNLPSPAFNINKEINLPVSVNVINWPITLDSSLTSENGMVICDINSDGKDEIIFTMGTKVYLVGGNGEVWPNWPIIPESENDFTSLYRPAVGDIDGDGEKEIVVVSSFTSTLKTDLSEIFAWKINGQPVTGFPIAAQLSGPPILFNIDNSSDGSLEIIGRSLDFKVNKVKIYAGTGELLQKFDVDPLLTISNTSSSPYGTMAIGDINGDDITEIIVRDNFGSQNDGLTRIYAYKSNGTRMWIKTLQYDGQPEIQTPPLLVNLDDDSDLEIVFSYRPEKGIVALDSDGLEIAGWKNEKKVRGIATATDLDGDGHSEIIFDKIWGSHLPVSVINSDGTTRFDIFIPDKTRTNGNILMGDMNGDGTKDIVMILDDNSFTAFDGTDGHQLYLFPIDDVVITPDATSQQMSAVGDIDGDGKAEIVTSALGTSKIFAYDLPDSDISSWDWKMMQHDPQNTRNFHFKPEILKCPWLKDHVNYCRDCGPCGEAPFAEFTHIPIPINGFPPFTVNFKDQSRNNPTSWFWDFGDGGSSTEQNPTYTYHKGGEFIVTLTVKNSFGTDTTSQSNIHIQTVTLGEQKAVALLLNFNDDQREPFTITEAENRMFSLNDKFSVNTFFHKNSYNKVSFSGKVSGWHTLPGNTDDYCKNNDLTKLKGDAYAKANQDINFTEYDHIIFIWIHLPNCIASGFGSAGTRNITTPDGIIFGTQTGSKANNFIDTNQKTSKGTLNHELGHGFGLNHANSLDCGEKVIVKEENLINNCSSIEYGNPFDTMGSGSENFEHFNAVYKEKLGWLKAPNILEVSQSGIYSLKNIELLTSDLQVLKIKRTSNSYLYIETREQNFNSGLLIIDHFPANNGEYQDYSHLLDATPNSHPGSCSLRQGDTDSCDAPDSKFEAGMSYTDPDAEFTVKILSKTNSVMKVEVCLKEDTCGSTNPVIDTPTADFTGSPISGTDSVTVNFTNSSTNLDNPTYKWDFGDGKTSTAESPAHTYTYSGFGILPRTFTVKLTVTNASRKSNTKTKTSYITVNKTIKTPVANFTGSPTSGTDSVTVNFTNSSTNLDNSTYKWDFGDGTMSTLEKPSHTYTYSGLGILPKRFTVKLSVSNNGGRSNTKTRFNYITVNKTLKTPVANFTGSPTSGTGSVSVNFTNFSTNLDNATYKWDFGDGTTSTLEKPSHKYTYSGLGILPKKFTVKLTVTNNGGRSNTKTRFNYITVNKTLKTPVANFTGSPTSGTGSVTVNFTNSSTNLDNATYKWDFGDGTTSTLEKPSHTYTYSGLGILPKKFTVKLSVSNNGGRSNTKTRFNYITVNKTLKTPVANFTGSSTSGTGSVNVNFTNFSTNLDNATYKWDFGDGTTSTLEKPSHTYTYSGLGILPKRFTVKLSVSNNGGRSNTKTRFNYITVNKNLITPTANFTSNKSWVRDFREVTFTNTSSNLDSNATFLWHFGDGGTSTLKNPKHTYPKNTGFTKPYNVTLTVINPGDKTNSKFKRNFIEVRTATSTAVQPTANFISDKTWVRSLRTIKFTNTSTNLDSNTTFLWHFGDGGTSTLKNPSHKYPKNTNILNRSNFYDVTLTVTNPGNKTSRKFKHNLIEVKK